MLHGLIVLSIHRNGRLLFLIMAKESQTKILQKSVNLIVCFGFRVTPFRPFSVTSKLSGVESLHSVTTHGFRGEALAALAHCASIEIVSRTSLLHPAQMKVLYRGHLQALGECRQRHEKIGTTVKVSDLFWCYPVRRMSTKSSSEMTKEAKRAFERVALVHYQISFSLFDASTATMLFDLPSQQTLLGRFSQLFGNNLAVSLRKVLSEDSSKNYRFEIYLPQPNAKRIPTKELQFCCIYLFICLLSIYYLLIYSYCANF